MATTRPVRRKPERAVLQRLVRSIHVRAMRRGLPRRVALYFHELDDAASRALEELVPDLRRRGYHFVTPEEFREESPDCRALISFDDNYRSWFDGLQLLDRLGLKVTFFVNTEPLRDRATQSQIDDYYNRIAYYGERTPLDSHELKELVLRGHVIGSHTHSHPVLSQLTYEAARREILLARETLESILQRSILDFAFPFGMRRYFSPELWRFCRDAGLTVAYGIPGLLHRPAVEGRIDRSPWRSDRSLEYNLHNLEVDGWLFERLTGRAAVI